MTQTVDYRPAAPAAVAALLAGATVWGLIWYPYRVLASAGLPGGAATTLTYAVALLLALLFLRRRLRGARPDVWLVAIALSAGGCNLGYVLATLHGQVMRVLLLFYLAPLWTVLLSRGLLGERLTRTGSATIGMSMVGAGIMLWRPELGAPWPRAGAEWIGLAAGFLFALSNVLIRRADHYSIELKSTAVFFGVVVLGSLSMAWQGWPVRLHLDADSWVIIGAVSLALLIVNLVVQFGLTRVPANRAVVILLFELVVAALGSWWLAGEVMGPQEWLGGALIAAATAVSAGFEMDASAERK